LDRKDTPMQRRCLTVALTAAAIIFMLTLAACGEEMTKLSLKQAVETALAKNPTVRQSSRDLSAAQSRAWTSRIPTSLSAGVSTGYDDTPLARQSSSQVFGRLDFEGLSGLTTRFDVSPLGTGGNTGSISLQARQPLARGKGFLSDKANAAFDAHSALQVQRKQVLLARQQTVTGVIRAYLNAVLARDQVNVQEQAVAIAQEAAVGARKRADEGLVAEIEVSRAEIRVAQTKDELNRRVQGAKATMDQLMTAIGEGIGREPELTDGVPESPSQAPDIQQAINKAIANRTELAIYDLQIADRTRALARSQDQLRPALDAVIGFSSNETNPGLLGSSIFNNRSLTAGLEYTFTLDRRILNEERDITQRDLTLFAALRDFEKEQITADVRDAYRSISSAKQSLEILGQNLQTAKDNLSIAQRMVDEGLSSNRDVLDAQESLTRVQSGVLSAKVDLFLAGINLQIATGEDITKTVLP
jgi:outer membrane protein